MVFTSPRCCRLVRLMGCGNASTPLPLIRCLERLKRWSAKETSQGMLCNMNFKEVNSPKVHHTWEKRQLLSLTDCRLWRLLSSGETNALGRFNTLSASSRKQSEGDSAQLDTFIRCILCSLAQDANLFCFVQPLFITR